MKSLAAIFVLVLAVLALSAPVATAGDLAPPAELVAVMATNPPAAIEATYCEQIRHAKGAVAAFDQPSGADSNGDGAAALFDGKDGDHGRAFDLGEWRSRPAT